MHKKLLVFIAVLSFSFSAFSQDEKASFPITGVIQYATPKILVGNFLNVNPDTGLYFIPAEKTEDGGKYNQVRFQNPFNQRFLVSGVSDSQFFVDEKSQYGKLVLVPELTWLDKLAPGKLMDVGNIYLEKLYEVSGKIKFPSFIDAESKKTFMIEISSRTPNNGMVMVAMSTLGQKDSFKVRLPNGNYTFFFDYQDSYKNWRRITRNVTIQDNAYQFPKEISAKVALDDMVLKKMSLESVFDKMIVTDISEKKFDILEKTESSTDRVTVMYFFAHYCAPCFGESGLIKYLKMASDYSNQISVLGIHSDSYEFSGGPSSDNDLEEQMVTQKKWSLIRKQLELSAVKNKNVEILWQPPQLAKALKIDGYPTVLIFKNNILRSWFVGTDADTHIAILNLLNE